MDEASPAGRDSHYEIEVLLPWYVNGQLDAAEVAVVDRHLESCGSCRVQLAEERELRDAVVALPFAAPPAGPDIPVRRPAARRTWARVRHAVMRPRTAAWFLSGQAAAILAMFVILQPSMQSSPAYRTLGAAPDASAGNVVVVFRPTATEADLRHTLTLAGATIVGGPNAAGAYTLRIAPQERASRLKLLRSQSSVVLAELIDGDEKP